MGKGISVSYTHLDVYKRQALGLAVSRRLAALEAYRRAAVVLAFAPMGTEADITPFLRRVLADGKRLCLPACTGPGVMEAREAADLALLAPASAYGILEPAGPAVPPEKIDLAVVPCLAAGRDHTRLGLSLIHILKGKLQFDEFYALRDVSLQVEKGDFYGLVGLKMCIRDRVNARSVTAASLKVTLAVLTAP